jgi:hypothetical protein
MRAYVRMFASAFPFMIKQYLNGVVLPDFTMLVKKSFKYLFNMAVQESSQIEEDKQA